MVWHSASFTKERRRGKPSVLRLSDAAALEEDSPSAGGGLRRTVVHATDQFLDGLKSLGKAFKI